MMEETQLFYVVFDANNSLALVEGKEQLISVLGSYNKPKIKTFDNESDAKKYLQAHLEMSGKAEMKPIRNDNVTVTEGIKKMKVAEDSNKEIKIENSIIYEHFNQDSKEIALAKYHIKPEMNYSLYFDGASKGNPGQAGAGYVIYNSAQDKVYSGCSNLGSKTNNQAEYCGVIYGLKSALNLGIKRIEVYGDSQLIIYQLTGKYKVKNFGLKPFYEEAKKLEQKFQKINYNWVRREENTEADALSNKGIELV